MVTGTLPVRHLLRQLHGSVPFVEFCQQRGIPFAQTPADAMIPADARRWQAALRSVPEPEQARIALELAQVQELSTPAALAHLVEGLDGRDLPPDSLPATAATALWFFLHHRDLFQQVFLHHEIREVHGWRSAAAAAGITLQDPRSRQAALAESLREFYRVREGTGRFCAVEAYQLRDCTCFIAYLSDRLQLLDVFTDDGRHATQPARPAFAVLFAYYPGDGTLLLKARQRAAGRVLDLFQRFGRTVLGVQLDETCLDPAFSLNVFKRRFDPPLDGEDMESVRVKALALAYPERYGRRRVLLETLAGDRQFAILDLLQEHGGRDGTLDQLDVRYAEVEVTLRVEGERRRYLICLWPDRCSLDHTPLGERLRGCLRRWGLAYVG